MGAGHTGASANNILVASNRPNKELVLPRRLAKHTPMLVELGKHASAPDRSFDGRFDIGMDANVFYSEGWGSRDIAAAVGVTAIKRMVPEYSFPRDVTTLIPESDWFRLADSEAALFPIGNRFPVTKDGKPIKIGLQFEDDLDQRKVSKNLVQEFQKQDIQIKEAEVLIGPLDGLFAKPKIPQDKVSDSPVQDFLEQDKDTQLKEAEVLIDLKKWFLKTEDRMYLIQKIHSGLQVYENLDYELNNKRIPNGLAEVFKEKNMELKAPEVSVLQRDKRWLIKTKDRRFRVQKQERDDNRKIFDVYDGNLEKEYPKHFTPIDREYIIPNLDQPATNTKKVSTITDPRKRVSSL